METTDDSTVDWKPQYDVPHSAAVEIMFITAWGDCYECSRCGPGYVMRHNPVPEFTGVASTVRVTVDGNRREWLVKVTGQGWERSSYKIEFDVLKYPEGK